MQKIERKTHEIDAAGKAVGRVAAEAASILRGKNRPDFEPHLDNGDLVTIINAGQVKFTGRKLAQKDFRHHSMHPGGLKTIAMATVFKDDPTEVMKHAVYGMLPKNKHRGHMFLRLTVKA
jgi:large subunit ribosomal protein L13